MKQGFTTPSHADGFHERLLNPVYRTVELEKASLGTDLVAPKSLYTGPVSEISTETHGCIHPPKGIGLVVGADTFERQVTKRRKQRS